MAVKIRLKKNGSEEASFLQDRSCRFQIPQRWQMYCRDRGLMIPTQIPAPIR